MLNRIIIFAILLSHTIFASTQIMNQNDFKSLVDKTIDWRAKTIKFNLELNNPQKIVTSRQITTIHEEIINEYKVIRDQYWSILNIVRPIAAYKATKIHYNTSGKNGPILLPFDWYGSLIRGTIIYDLFTIDRHFYAIDLNSAEGLEIAQNMKMALASAIILYDNYALALNQLQNTSKVRRIINNDNIKNEDFLEEINRTFNRRNFKTLTEGYNIYEGLKQQEKIKPDTITPFGQYLDKIVESSYLYSIREEVGLKDIRQERWTHFFQKVEDRLDLTADSALNSSSKFFGNTIGLVATRKGKVLDLSQAEVEKLLKKLTNTLRPLDVLLEKTPFRLTDKFIPGYWGHIAIWLGTKEQLQAAGLWNNLSDVLKEKVETGHYVLEALRPGVQVNKLVNFLNIDDLAIIRPNFIKSFADAEYYLNRAEKQIGKEYDFSFDVETDEKIVCSELAYVVFDDPEFDWTINKSVGRYTISPDNVAEKGFAKSIQESDYSFTPILLYHDGLEVASSSNLISQFEQLTK